MRYVFVSDVHGMYDKMKEALERARFDAASDTLVCLGDMFDRGPQSKEILDYLMALPNAIFIWGNHDTRLNDLLRGKMCDKNDYYNGVLETLQSFCPENKGAQSIPVLLNIFTSDNRYRKIYKKLQHYYSLCHRAVEFTNYIATHSWLPPSYKTTCRLAWIDACWTDPRKEILRDNINFNKMLIVGHFFAWIMRRFDKKPWHTDMTRDTTANDYDFSDTINTPFNYKGMAIFIDGCATIENGLVNTFIIEDAAEPIVYDA